jgi:hypothetical protein
VATTALEAREVATKALEEKARKTKEAIHGRKASEAKTEADREQKEALEAKALETEEARHRKKALEAQAAVNSGMARNARRKGVKEAARDRVQ